MATKKIMATFEVDTEKSTVKFVKVTPGIVVNDQVEILEPAVLDKPLVTLGNHLLVDGSKVTIPEHKN